MPLPSLQHCFWFEACNTAFVFLPKVACTSWKLFFAEALHGPLPEDLGYRTVHQVARLGLPLVDAMPPEKQQAFCAQAGDRIALVAMLRDPRERILSAYLDKFINRTDRQTFGTVIRPAIQAYHGLPDEQLPTFLHFLQWLAAGAHPECTNDHWRPMHQLLGLAPGDAPHGYQQLWRLDQIDEAATELNRRLGSQVAFPSFQALGPRQASGSAEQLERSFADPSVQTLFAQLYQPDLDLYSSLQPPAAR